MTKRNHSSYRHGSLQQQTKFDDFLDEFKNERPHQALAMKCPAGIHTPSTGADRGLAELDSSFHDKTIQVACCGRTCLHRKKIDLSTVLAGQAVVSKKSKRVFDWSAL